MAGNSNSGGKRKGAGRKSKAEKVLIAGFTADWFTPAIQKIKWSELVQDKDPRIRLESIKYITDRIHGKPKQTIDSNISGELSVLSEVIAKARKRVE